MEIQCRNSHGEKSPFVLSTHYSSREQLDFPVRDPSSTGESENIDTEVLVELRQAKMSHEDQLVDDGRTSFAFSPSMTTAAIHSPTTFSLIALPPPIPLAERTVASSSSSFIVIPPDYYADSETVDSETVDRSDKLASEKSSSINLTVNNMEKKRSSSFILSVSLAVSATVSLIFGYNCTLLNTCLNTVAAEFAWCDPPGSLVCVSYEVKSATINSTLFIFAGLGSLLSGNALVRFGARSLLLLDMAIFVVGHIFSLCSAGFATLFVARSFLGIAVGMATVVPPAYISEMAPKESRGFYGTFHELFITIGCFLGVVAGLPLNSIPIGDSQQIVRSFDSIWWRVMYGLGLIPALIAVILFLWVLKFETPHFYIRRERYQEAIQILQRIHGCFDVEKELKEIEMYILGIRSGGLKKGTLRNDHTFLKVVLIGSTFAAGLQLVGTDVFMATSNKLFSDSGINGSIITTMSVVMTFLQIPTTFIAMVLIDRVGRRALMIGGLIGMMASLSPGVILLYVGPNLAATPWVAVCGSFGFIVFYALSYGPVCWVYVFEIFPVEVKDIGGGVAMTVQWLAAFGMVFLTSFITTEVAYTLFLCLQFAVLLFVIFVMKETAGRAVGDSPYVPSKSRSTSTRPSSEAADFDLSIS